MHFAEQKKCARLAPAQQTHAAIEGLEVRRMLAVFNATNGNDTIVITQTNFGETSVSINGIISKNFDATMTINALGGNDTINFHSMPESHRATLNGGSGDDYLQNMTSNLEVYRFNFLFNGGDGTDSVSADNDLNTAVGSIRIQDDGIVRENPEKFLLSYSELEILAFSDTGRSNTIRFNAITLNRATIIGSEGGDAIYIERCKPTSVISVDGALDDDHITLGRGDLSADILGSVNVNGGAGINKIFIDNSTDATFSTQTLNGATYTDGQAHTFASIDSFTITEGPGGTNLSVNATIADTAVQGGSGNDSFTVGGGDINSNFLSTLPLGLAINGSDGNDQITFNDVNDSTLDKYIFERPDGYDRFVKDGPVNDYFIYWSGIEQATLEASNAPTIPQDPSEIIVTDFVTPLRIKANAGSDRVIIADASAPVAVHTGLGDIDSLIVNSDFAVGDAPVTVLIDQNDDVETLDIKAGGTLRVGSNAVLTKTRQENPAGVLNMAGVIDLAGGAFLSRSGGPTVATFQTLLNSGFNSGSWNGTTSNGAINSSLAVSTPSADGVGYGLSSQIAISTIGGFNIAPGDLLLRHTLDGDTDLDHDVDFNDLLRVGQNYNPTSGGKVWTQGNFNYNAADNVTGAVGFADLLRLSQNYNNSLATAGAVGAARFSSRLIEELR